MSAKLLIDVTLFPSNIKTKNSSRCVTMKNFALLENIARNYVCIVSVLWREKDAMIMVFEEIAIT